MQTPTLPPHLASLQITNQEAGTDRRKRRAARRSFLPFVHYVMPTFQEGRHHVHMCRAADAVVKGVIDRLIIIAPPRHTKTELFSRKLGAYYLGHHPDRFLIGVSHTGDFQRGVGRAARDLIQNNSNYKALFPHVTLKQDSRAANRWHTEQGGSFLGAGIRGTIVGEGAHLLVIDDPFKSRQEADSLLIRDRTWHWYIEDAYSRLMPGGAIIIVTTRWHSDDLVGRAIKSQQAGGEQWHILYLPALALTDRERGGRDPLASFPDILGREPGEALWREWYDEAALKRIRITQTVLDGPRAWSALYQGMPTEAQGIYFRRDWFKRYTPGEQPVFLQFFAVSDWATTVEGGDWTVHIVGGVDDERNLWLLDHWRKQADTGVGAKAQMALIRQHPGITEWGEDRAQIEKAIGPLRKTLFSQEGVSQTFEGYPVSANKATRARSFQGWASYGKIYVPQGPGYEWGDEFIEELVEFTGEGDEIDDQVDCGSLFGQQIVKHFGPEEPIPPPPESGRTLKTLVDQMRAKNKKKSGGIYR